MSRVTGEQLYEELCAAAQAAGVPVKDFADPLFPAGDVAWKLEQMRIAHRPLRRTIERVRALIRGEPFDAPECRPRGDFDRRYQQHTRAEIEAMGLPPSARALRDRRAVELHQRSRERTELLRALAERAHYTRRPGQTVADRVRELRREIASP